MQLPASSNQFQIPQTQAPITPNVVGTPTAPNAVPVNVPPFPAGADSTFAHTNHPNLDIPNHPMNPWPSQPNQGISSGMQDPLMANDPWRQLYQSSSQAAGVPDQPFPHSLANSPDQQHPFAQQGLGTVIPPPPGFSPVQPIQVNTPQGLHMIRENRKMIIPLDDRRSGCHRCQPQLSRTGRRVQRRS